MDEDLGHGEPLVQPDHADAEQQSVQQEHAAHEAEIEQAEDGATEEPVLAEAEDNAHRFEPHNESHATGAYAPPRDEDLQPGGSAAVDDGMQPHVEPDHAAVDDDAEIQRDVQQEHAAHEAEIR